MSIWNLPLPVHLHEVRTPTPAPLLPVRRRRATPSATTELDGCEPVLRCACCGGSSTDSLAGAAGWHTLRRCESAASSFCPECYSDFDPLRLSIAARYAAARGAYRAAQAMAAAYPFCPDAQTALAVASLVFGQERQEWLDAEQEGRSRKAS